MNKNKTEDYERLKQLLSQSHLLFLPTRAECYGIVYCEASAYGLPSIATATGGVTSIVKDGVNGFALPENAGAEEYAEKIAEILSPEQLSVLSESSRKRYEEHLTYGKNGAGKLMTF
ncbi:glycosyltransferase family 4 protein [Kaistella anthropi]|nr:glycosyltransferase family 4 protein [Kaistella anthropi]